MSIGRGSKRIDTYPYRYGGESLEMDYVEYKLDGGSTHSIGDTLELDLTDETSWETVSLKTSITVSKDTLEKVFPSSPPCSGALVVTAYCPTNHHRSETVIENDPLSPGEHTAAVELDRELLRGRVELTPQLVRTSPLGSQPSGHTGPPFAERSGRKLAHGLSGQIDVDEPSGGRSKNLPTIPISFSDAPFAADDGNMWYVDLTDEATPKLYINSDHGFVVPLFQDSGQHGRGRVRQLVVDLYGTQIMTQFVVEAAALYVGHDEIKYPWQERMLTEVCGDLFEGKSPDQVETMLDPDDLSDTINQIATTIQRRRAPHESLERVLELDL